MWTEKDARDLRDVVGEFRLRHGPSWGYYELARNLPFWMLHEVVAKAETGCCELGESEEAAFRAIIEEVLGRGEASGG